MSEILINAGAGEIRVALIADGRLEQIRFERTLGVERGCHSLVGDIVLGRVQRVTPAMQAAFVDIGHERTGFLALREAQALCGKSDATISDCVHEGQAILVQVIKDPIGDKGARLAAGVTLPGRLLVMVPKLSEQDGQPGLSLSRRIEDETTRAALLALGQKVQAAVPEAGFIFRTAAVGMALEDLIDDAKAQAETWRGIDQQRKAARPPATLYRDLGPIERTMRDLVRGDVTRVRIDDAEAAATARDYCRRAMPHMVAMIETVAPPLFDDTLEEEIAGLAHPRVRLASGGWITLEATEALTAIDVNSGGFVQASGLEETSLTVNLEAAREIGRQLRLRAIGGLIVVDFIHLADAAHVARVLAALQESLAFDRTPVQISPMAEFGIVAITRKRTGEPLSRLTSHSCAACRGAGRQPSPESVALELLRQVEREARAHPGRALVARAAPQVTDWLDQHADAVRAALARRGAGRLSWDADPSKHTDRFDVQTA